MQTQVALQGPQELGAGCGGFVGGFEVGALRKGSFIAQPG